MVFGVKMQCYGVMMTMMMQILGIWRDGKSWLGRSSLTDIEMLLPKV